MKGFSTTSVLERNEYLLPSDIWIKLIQAGNCWPVASVNMAVYITEGGADHRLIHWFDAPIIWIVWNSTMCSPCVLASCSSSHMHLRLRARSTAHVCMWEMSDLCKSAATYCWLQVIRAMNFRIPQKHTYRKSNLIFIWGSMSPEPLRWLYT